MYSIPLISLYPAAKKNILGSKVNSQSETSKFQHKSNFCIKLVKYVVLLLAIGVRIEFPGSRTK